MSDANLERITILLQARDRDFQRAMDRNNKIIARMTRDAERDTQRMNRTVSANMDRMGQSALAFGRDFATGIAAAASAAALGFLATGLRQTVRGIAAVGDEARRAGIEVEAFQQWAFVGEQNRIAVDSLVDGFKELNLRADEFIATGGGSAADAFVRLGYDAAGLGQALEDPSELMLEIIGRLQQFDRAAQIRIADEVFGGTGGERFVQLIAQGEDGLRRTMDRAREVGAVMDESMIAAATEVDRRFSELTTRLVSLGREIVVGWSFIAEDIAAAFAADDTPEAIRRIEEHTLALATEARDAQHSLMNLAVTAQQLGNERLAEVLAGIAAQMVQVSDAFGRGEISADALHDVLGTLLGAAETAFRAMGDIDNVNLDNAEAVVSGLRAQLAALAQQASVAAAEVAAATITPVRQAEHFWDTEEDRFGPGRFAPTHSPRPRRAPPMIGEPVTPSAGIGGGGGGRGGAGGFASAVADIQARTRALEMEAAALVAVAASGRQYADAIEFARLKAELLSEAMAEGREVTPALIAEVEQLAEAYLTAGQSAEDAAARMERVREDTERGIDVFSDFFMSVVQGGDAARQALARLLVELLRVRAQRALAGLAGTGGGFFSMLGSLFAGRAGGGSVRAGQPYRVNENTPNSEVFVPSRSGGILNVAQAKDALAGGGRIELVVHAGPGVTVEQVGQIAAGVSMRVMQSGAARQRAGLSGSLRDMDLRGA